MSVVFRNNGFSILSAAIDGSTTSIPVVNGSDFPEPAAGEWFAITVVGSSLPFEIMHCTARTGNTLTVERGQEGTLARAFGAGARVDHRLTAATLEAAFEKSELWAEGEGEPAGPGTKSAKGWAAESSVQADRSRDEADRAAGVVAAASTINFDTTTDLQGFTFAASPPYIWVAGKIWQRVTLYHPNVGEELVVNGQFATDTDYNKGGGWTIAAGVATRTNTGSASNISQVLDEMPPAGTPTFVAFTITDIVSGTLQPKFSGGTNANGTVRSAVGTYSEVIVVNAGNNRILFTASASFAGSITNLSVRAFPAGAIQSADGIWWAPVVTEDATTTISVVTSIADMKALDTAMVRAAYLIHVRRGGVFYWDPDVTIATHQADFMEGVYIAPNPASNGAWRRQVSSVLDPSWWDIRGDNSTDNHDGIMSLIAYMKTLGNGNYAAARVSFPAGRFRTRPITTDIRAFTLQGAGRLSTRFSAVDPAQSHVFHFTDTNTAITMEDFEITGWTTTGELANYPAYGILFEGGTNELRHYRINRCRRLCWHKRGNYSKFKTAQMGFFDVYALQLGHVDYAGEGGSGAAMSETRIDEIAAYSSAINVSGGVSENLGVQFKFSTDNGATIMRLCEGGSTVIGVEVVDGLGLGTARATGFLTLIDYNSGKNSAAGMWIKDNGNNLRAINCRFSARDASSADGVRLESSICSAVFSYFDAHWTARDGLRVLSARAVVILGGALYDIGLSGSNARGINLVSGNAKVAISSLFVDNQFKSASSWQMLHGIFVGSGFSGEVDYYETMPSRNFTVAKIAKQAASSATVRHHTMSAATL